MRPAKFLLLTGICGEQSTHSLVPWARLWKGSETEHSGSWDLQFRSTQLSSSTGPCCRLWQRPPLLLVSIVHFSNYVWNVDLQKKLLCHWCLEWWFKLHDRGVTDGWWGSNYCSYSNYITFGQEKSLTSQSGFQTQVSSWKKTCGKWHGKWYSTRELGTKSLAGHKFFVLGTDVCQKEALKTVCFLLFFHFHSNNIYCNVLTSEIYKKTKHQ